jgi:hypothetical protein
MLTLITTSSPELRSATGMLNLRPEHRPVYVSIAMLQLTRPPKRSELPTQVTGALKRGAHQETSRFSARTPKASQSRPVIPRTRSS